jgi:hypothetical protein
MKKGPHLIMYDSGNDERICSLDFGGVRPGVSSPEVAVWLWNKKDFDDAPTATDVRVCVQAGNRWSEGIVDNKYLSVRSDGVMDPDECGIVDDSEEEFAPIGGSLTNPDDYHSIGDIPSNCARRLFFRIDLPLDFSVNGVPRMIVQVGNLSEKVKWLYMSEE